MATDIERVVRHQLDQMTDAEWEGIADRQQLALIATHTIAVQRLVDRLESQYFQCYIFTRTGNLFSVATITKRVADHLRAMTPEDWRHVGPDRKAHLVGAIDEATEDWMVQETQRLAASRIWGDLLEILKGLPPIVRTTFMLYKVQGCSVQKISETLKITEEDARRYLAQAADAFSNRPM